MNMNKDILLYFALLLWFVVPVSAQPTIFTPDMTVDEGTTIEVDVKVNDFESVQSMQFSVNWDPTVLQFDSLSNLNALPDYSVGANFNIANAIQEGKLTTLWLDNMLLGLTLDDSTTLFSIVFNVIGDADSSSSVSITNDPLEVEFSDAAGNILPVILENGMITIVGPLSVRNTPFSQSNELFTLYQNEPNPFESQSVIRFDLNRSMEVTFEIYDINGKLVYTLQNQFQEGQNSIVIDADKLPGTGNYIYTMKTNDFSLTNKMVLVK